MNESEFLFTQNMRNNGKSLSFLNNKIQNKGHVERRIQTFILRGFFMSFYT